MTKMSLIFSLLVGICYGFGGVFSVVKMPSVNIAPEKGSTSTQSSSQFSLLHPIGPFLS